MVLSPLTKVHTRDSKKLKLIQLNGQLRSSGSSSIRLDVLDERNVVPLEHDPAEGAPVLLLDVVLLGFVQHQVHVLVESDCKRNPIRIRTLFILSFLGTGSV